MAVGTIGTVEWRGHQLGYEVRGTGDQPLVLVHGLLLPARINGIVATMLAERGHKVILFDLAGHGISDKPLHASRHRLEYAGQQVVALLDQLGIDRAVVGGVSLGANTALQVAVDAPERVQGLVCEMPVLERGTIGAMITLFPLLLALRYAARPVQGFFRLVQRLPRTDHEVLNAVIDTGGEARAMAAIMHGYTAGPVCPPQDERVQITAPALVIGHRWDWIHPLDDADALAGELPNARLVHAKTMIELRVRPERLVGEIATFLDDAWRDDAAALRIQDA